MKHSTFNIQHSTFKIGVVASFLVLFMFFSLESFACGKIETKNKCKWWSHKYKAMARVHSALDYHYGKDTGCDPNHPYHKSESNNCAWQEATNLGGAGTLAGAVFATPWQCGRGDANSDLYYDLLPGSYSGESDQLATDRVYESTKLNYDAIEFQEDRVVIPNLNGEMYTNGLNIFSSLEIVIWQPRHDYEKGIEDTIANKEEYLWYGKIELINGRVNLTGDFPKESFRLSGDKNGYTIIFQNADIVANLTYNDYFDSDEEIVVTVISDCGSKEKNLIDRKIVETEENSDLSLSVFPNPVNSDLTISFDTEVISEGTISLYDQEGNFIQSLHEGSFKGRIPFKMHLNRRELKSGMYFLVISSGNQKYIKQILLN